MTQTFDRRRFFGTMRLGGLFDNVPGAFREALRLTPPPQTIGPFYPNKSPLDQDNDLVILSDSLTPAVGKSL